MKLKNKRMIGILVFALGFTGLQGYTCRVFQLNDTRPITSDELALGESEGEVPAGTPSSALTQRTIDMITLHCYNNNSDHKGLVAYTHGLYQADGAHSHLVPELDKEAVKAQIKRK